MGNGFHMLRLVCSNILIFDVGVCSVVDSEMDCEIDFNWYVVEWVSRCWMCLSLCLNFGCLDCGCRMFWILKFACLQCG